MEKGEQLKVAEEVERLLAINARKSALTDEERFRANYERAYGDEPAPAKIVDACPTDEAAREAEFEKWWAAAFAELAGEDQPTPAEITKLKSALAETEAPAQCNLVNFSDAELEEFRASAVYVPIERKWTSPYDRVVLKLHATEAELERTPVTDFVRRAVLERQIAELKVRRKVELERDGDPKWRKRYEIDEWRAENPELRNAERRKVRDEANVITPKHILAAETEEQKRERIKAQDTARKAKNRATRTPEQIAAERARNAERMRKTRAAVKSQTPTAS